MESIWSTDKLTLFIAFVLPGFISMQIYRLFVAGDDDDLVKKLPAIVSYSALHYLVWGWTLSVVPAGPRLTRWIYIVVLLLPVLWPFIILLIRDYAKWSKVFFGSRTSLLDAMLKPEATPWDRVFTNRQRFVRVTLKEGGYVGGFLAKGSEVSTYPIEPQLFIRNAHRIDQTTGTILERMPATGLLVNGTEIKLIEIIEVDEGEPNGKEDPRDPRADPK